MKTINNEIYYVQANFKVIRLQLQINVSYFIAKDINCAQETYISTRK